MTKIFEMQSEKDKLIDRLITDKNKLFRKFKNLEKEQAITKNQLRALKKSHRELTKRHREVLNELLEEKEKAQ